VRRTVLFRRGRSNRYRAGTIRTRLELTQAAVRLYSAIKLPPRRNEKRCQGCRACAARQDRPSRRAIVFVDRPLRPVGQNFRQRAFLLRQKQGYRRRGRRCRFRRLFDRENFGKEFCSRDRAKIGRLVFLRARRAGDVQVIPSSVRSGCATGSKERRWIGQGPNS